MLFQKKVKAIVLSKNVEELEDPPALEASGAYSVVAMAAMQDESRSMWRRTTLYHVSFSIDGKTKEFRVDRNEYDILKIGDKGMLEYSANKYISFEKDN
jgi:hypothetical protein